MTLEMREEIAAAVVFVTRLIKQKGSVQKEKVDEFSSCLSAILVEKFKNHWYKDKPAKGQGYRCIRINPAEPIDPVLGKAACDSGLEYEELLIPVEMTLWVDPLDVCCRFGENHGSFCTLAANKNGNLENRAHIINIEEILEKELERHNQTVNIVTTRSNIQVRPQQFARGLYYGKGANFHTKQQQNFYNNQQNHKHHRNRNNSKSQEEQVNGVRVSPDHVNEVRQQFMDQVTSVAGSNKNSPSKAIPVKPKAQHNGEESLKSGSSPGSYVPPEDKTGSGSSNVTAGNMDTHNEGSGQKSYKGKNTGGYSSQPNSGSNKGSYHGNHHTKGFNKGDNYHWNKGNNSGKPMSKYH